jgi:PIN domain nuclease of toxin-antitoxin system
MLIYLDTHVVVWLYQKEKTLFSSKALDIIEKEQCTVSPAVLLELEYLFEIDKIQLSGKDIIAYLQDTIGLSICRKPFYEIITQALLLNWTRDPFDRIITAQAALNKSALVTKDRVIHVNYPAAVW